MPRCRWLAAAAVSLALILPTRPGHAVDLAQTLADGGQRNTIAFDGFSFITGNLEAQSFFPPGKVADYWGFQYLRDNTSNGNGHNTSFLTSLSLNVLSLLSDEQFAMLADLAGSQIDAINEYGYLRFALMQAFRRQVEGDVPLPYAELSVEAVRRASADIYRLDGQISFDRAVMFADLYRTLTPEQVIALDALAAGGFDSWTVTAEMEAAAKERTKGFGHDKSVAVTTYAGDLFSWYEGSIAADVYFAPERQGTYFGSFYIKDAPAVGHPGYVIDSQLTANVGQAFLAALSSNGLDVLIRSLVETQRNDLYAGIPSIVQMRTEISTLLRSLVGLSAPSKETLASVRDQVLDRSAIYGELDGRLVYAYAMTFSRVNEGLTRIQRQNLIELRTSVLSGTYNGEPFDYSVATTPYLYSAPIIEPSVLEPYIANTDDLFRIDSDVDGGFDDEDICTTISASGTPTSPPDQTAAKLRLTLSRFDHPTGEQMFKASGNFNPASTTPPVEPSVNGVHVRVADALSTLYEVNVPGGLVGTSPCGEHDGWMKRSSANGTTWRYRNLSDGLPDGTGGCNAGAARGIASITMRDATRTGAKAYRFKATSTSATILAPSLPLTQLQFNLTLGARYGAQTASQQAASGQCTEWVITGAPAASSAPAPYCKLSSTLDGLRSIRCVGP